MTNSMQFGPMRAIRWPATLGADQTLEAALAAEFGPGHGTAYWSRLNHGDALRLGRRVSPDKISEVGLQLFGVTQLDPT